MSFINLFNNLYPDEIADSAYSIDYEGLFAKGYRGIIYDIDNTLVEHGAPANSEAVALFDRLKAIGYRIFLLSNNEEPRVKMFNRDVNVLYICKAGKPATSGFIRAMELMGTDKDNTLLIGDQIFTDIWGGRRCGIRSILVGKIAAHEEIQIVLKRRLEAIVLFFYRRRSKREEVNDCKR